MNSLSHFHCSCVIQGSNQHQAFLASLSPWLHICHCSGRVCPDIAVWALWLSSQVLWEHRTSAGKQQQFQQPPLPLRAEQHHYTLGVPRTAGKVTSSANQPLKQQEKQTLFKSCFAELGPGPGCILILTTVWKKPLTWYLHLWALCL